MRSWCVRSRAYLADSQNPSLPEVFWFLAAGGTAAGGGGSPRWVMRISPQLSTARIFVFFSACYGICMPTYFEGVIKLSEKNSFKGTDGQVEFFKYYIQADTEGSQGILILNSKTDFSSFQGKPAVFTGVLRNDAGTPKLLRFSLQKVTPIK